MTKHDKKVSKLSYKTVSANDQTVVRTWYLVDAQDKVLGRMSSEIAKILRGKNKPYFTPHVDCGDYVVVINAEKIKLTGKKWENKEYIRYTGYPGGLRSMTSKQLLDKKPFALVENAVRGMLPRNKLGRSVFKKLFVYAGEDHPHSAQKPEKINL
ncbi:MAG: 50S ribosomal protein L13 [Bacteroidetes bacterium]|nr:50S ribosomal protein L13 [Bacteroidota bacterium]